MNWKNRLTNYNFWISIFSAVLLILQALKIKFDIAYVNEIFTAVLGLLVVIGIISDPTRTTVKTTEQKDKSMQENKLPINTQNEIGDVNSKNDIKTFLEISKTLDEKMLVLGEKIKEIQNFGLEKINNTLVNKEQENLNVINFEETNHIEEKVIEPTVVENDNPYVDVIN